MEGQWHFLVGMGFGVGLWELGKWILPKIWKKMRGKF